MKKKRAAIARTCRASFGRAESHRGADDRLSLAVVNLLANLELRGARPYALTCQKKQENRPRGTELAPGNNATTARLTAATQRRDKSTFPEPNVSALSVSVGARNQRRKHTNTPAYV